MCPFCLSTIVWLAAGGSAAGAAALVAGWRSKGKDDGDDPDDTSNREP
jgi:hypothetical protein